MSFVCFACGQHIRERHVLECDRRHWHQSCLRCAATGHPPTDDRMFTLHNGQYVCREHYRDLQSICRVCRQRIDAHEWRVQTPQRLNIHQKCMSCAACRQSLDTGDKFVFTPITTTSQDNQQQQQQQSSGGRLLCHKCAAPPHGQQASSGGRRGRRRATTTTTASNQT
ncbi:LIM/homeobox protein Lhx3-like [Oppia nitens]|uniref:LIM/homeobox protein Lhx3-like n=1 Tax=Oppia nitens TaxID=1686743 RepID=UPI0023DA3F9A|nr:LIM/homeobox protein Lhx3-like [Oppia nitens]